MIDLDSLFKMNDSEADLGQIENILRDSISSCDIDYYCYVNYSLAKSGKIDREITNYPSRWRTMYHRLGWFGQDPLVQCVRRSSVPLDWSDMFNQPIYKNNSICISRSEEISQFGLSINISDCLGLRGILSLARPKYRTSWEINKHRYMRDFLVVSTIVHQACAKLANKTDHIPEFLSPRQRQCLSLVAEGMTTKEIARTLSISDRVVREYIENTRDKLGCINRTHTISRALQAGLI